MSATASSWGWQGRHYAAEPHRDGRAWPSPKPPSKASEAEQHWADLLEKATPGVKDQVARAFRQWNNILRDYLRTETALRLTVGDDAQAVPVKIVDGMPLRFAEVLERFAGLDWLLLNRPMVEAAARGAKFLETSHSQACGLLDAMRRPVDTVASRMPSSGAWKAMPRRTSVMPPTCQVSVSCCGQGRRWKKRAACRMPSTTSLGKWLAASRTY